MKNLLRRVITLLTICILSQAGISQLIYPEIGQPCPDVLLSGIEGFSKKKMNIADFKGKYLILDFFSIGCASCFESFPKLTAIQRDFADSLKILLVGSDSSRLPGMYNRFKERENVNLSVVYDPGLCDRWGIHFFPHSVWIDRDGIVRAVTNNITKDNVAKFLKGEHFDFYNISNQAEDVRSQTNNKYSRNKAFLIEGNGGESNEFIQRSLLAKWNSDKMQYAPYEIDASLADGKFEAIGVGLPHLFNYAYFGNVIGRHDSLYDRVFKYPILEVRDTSIFKYDYTSGSNFFSYSLVVRDRPVSKNLFQSIMKNDLRNFFSMSAVIERRSMPCLKLVVVDDKKSKKMKSKGKEPFFDLTYVDLVIKNYPVDKIISGLKYFIGDKVPLINDTRISYNIDLDMHVSLLNLQQVKNALSTYGLDLVEAEKDMDVLVIRDLEKLK